MLCFKFHQNRLMNEEFDFWRAKFFQGALRGTERSDFKKASYKMVVLPHTKNPHIKKLYGSKKVDAIVDAISHGGPPKKGASPGYGPIN